MRVTVGGLPARLALSPTRAAKFAQAIRDRSAKYRLPGLTLNMVFRQPCDGVTLHPVHHHAQQLLIAPRLKLTVLMSWPTRAATLATANLVRPILRVERHIQTYLLQRIVSSAAEPAPLEQLTRRLITRAERVEVGPAGSPGNAGRTKRPRPEAAAQPFIPQPAVPPVRQIVRRRSAVEAERDISSRSTAGSHSTLQDENKAPSTGRSAPDAPINLSRLTDQVIQAIDRRIAAQRERLGRP